MPNPTLKDIQWDPILSRLAVAYQNDEYIADRICPVIPVTKISGKYFEFDTSKFRKVQSLRAMGAPAREVDYGLSQSSEFVCKDHALKQIVPDELKEQAPTPLTPEADAVENVKEKLLVEKEYDLAAYMASTSNLSNNTTLSGTDQWSDYANSDPIGDIEAGIESVHSKIFKKPNTLLLGQQTWNKLKHHPDIVDRLKYSGFGKVTPSVLGDLFDIPNVFVGGAGYESATEGQSSSMAYIWGKHAWLLYVASRPGIRSISFGYFFNYKAPYSVDRWYDKDRKGMWVRCHDYYVRETISTDAAYLIKDAIA